jgi:hypothetical protein
MVTQNIKDGILTVAKQTSDLKVDLRNLRRIQQLNNESMTDSIQETIKKITVSQYCIYFTVLETSAPWEIFTPVCLATVNMPSLMFCVTMVCCDVCDDISDIPTK